MSENSHLRKKQRDFTGGGIMGLPKKRGSTGDEAIDAKIQELVEAWSCGENNDLIQELIVTSLKIGKDCLPEGDLKLFNRSLKEMRQASNVFGPYEAERKVSIFGSARTQPDEKEYQTALKFAEEIRDKGYMVITGAGPGIMQAGHEGAGREGSFGLNIKLPFEQGANPTIDGDNKLINFNYFFTRKLSFVKESDAIVGLPGGFGTMDELFEVLTLIQTGKAQVVPIVLLDAPGGTYWKTWLQFVQDHLFRLGLISYEDFNLFMLTSDIEEAVEEVDRFYRNFHSYRYVGKDLAIRVKHPVTDQLLKVLNNDFTDLLESGEFKVSKALSDEANEPELADLPRIICHKKRGMAGRFREVINVINQH